MTNNEHTIIVPNDLLKNWEDRFHDDNENVDVLLIEAYEAGHRAGADQELEACCDQLERWGFPCAENLHNTRRSKSLSLKEQALKQLECVDGILRNQGMIKTDTIRRALEALPDD